MQQKNQNIFSSRVPKSIAVGVQILAGLFPLQQLTKTDNKRQWSLLWEQASFYVEAAMQERFWEVIICDFTEEL